MAIKVSQQNKRLLFIDFLRGLALLAMTIYHFVWDLEFFSWVLPATIHQPGWVYFARGIATSFLILTGISLVLAHGKGIDWKGFWKREIMIAGAALIITIATFIVFRNNFIFFGILHAIAVFSLLGLAFLRLPWFVCLIAAGLVFAIGENFTSDLFNHPALWWLGLSSQTPTSNDFVPLFPWFSATLIGIAIGKLGIKHGWRDKISAITLPRLLSTPLVFIGQHSLVYYLIHQPILFALVWTFTNVIGQPDKTPGFIKSCSDQCIVQQDKSFCQNYCTCIVDDLKQADLFTPFNNGELDIHSNQQVQDIIVQCTKNAVSEAQKTD